MQVLTNLPDRVRIFEVGPRDGLQNEQAPITTDQKIELINRLSKAGFSLIEAGSFVSPKWVPKMQDSGAVFAGIARTVGTIYSALTPNLKGLEASVSANADEVAVFAAASEAFSQKNINCTIAESLQRFEPLMKRAEEESLRVRGYVSCVAGCPYQGAVEPEKVAEVTSALIDMGCYEVSLGDTIGTGTPGSVVRMLDAVIDRVAVDKLAVHFHDTYGQAIANIYAALQKGVAGIDSSIAGLGGCPYAKGATGNVATEDVLYMLRGLNIETGIDFELALDAGDYISEVLQRPSQSKVGRALRSNSH